MTLKNFTNCTTSELEMILDWRNSENVRAMSFNNEIISLQDHLDFVTKLCIGGGNLNKYYFLVSDQDGYLGVISFTGMTSTEAEIGYYKNPERVEKGVGPKLLNMACDTAKNMFSLKEVTTEVFDNNPASIISIERAGFIELNELTGNIYLERNHQKIKVKTFKKTL